jgi:Domain of unknown function (DUF4157)
MERDARQSGGPEQAGGNREPQRASRPAPGKVTRTSRLSSSRGPAVQRKAAAPAPGSGGPQARSAWDHTMDPWMDAAHRGATALAEPSAAGPLVQAKLSISEPGDACEREADQVADLVLDQSAAGAPAISGRPQAVHRKLSPDMVSESANEGTPEMEQQMSSTRGGGDLLPEPVRTELGLRLGADFSDVRIHSGTAAEGMTAGMNARALTVGRDIYFGANQLDPTSREGQRLLVHELTHVVQQGAAPRTDGGPASPRADAAAIQPSFISYALKMGAKKASKAMLKKFVKEQIKDKLEKIAIKKFAKQFAKEADDLLGMLDDPWWVTGLGFVPIAGDLFDLAHVPKQIAKAMKKADQLEDKVKHVLRIQGKRASELIPASLARSPSFHAELADKTYAEIVQLAGSSERAAQMKKLIEQTERLMEKVN